MINIENTYLHTLNSELIHENEEIHISNSVISVLNLNALVLLKKVTICNCLIDKLLVNSCWFKGGLLFINNIVLSDIYYEMGGHNEGDFILEGNIFNGFFNFFDCQFEGNVIVKDNIFRKSSDILARENKGFDNLFERQLVIEGNIGQLDVFKNQ